MLKELLKSDTNARKVFGKKEQEIIMKQVDGIRLTQSERNRLSRDIKPKLAFIREAAACSSEFELKKNQDNKGIIAQTVSVIREDALRKNIKAILLFGSFADKTCTKNSDIDICVVFRKEVTLKDATRFRMRTAGKLPEKVDIQVFNTLPQKIKREIAANHKVLYKSSGYDNVMFSIRYLKDRDYFMRMQNIFGVEA